MTIAPEVDRMGIIRRQVMLKRKSSGVRRVLPNVVANEKLDDANKAGIVHMRLLEVSSYIGDMIGNFDQRYKTVDQ